MIGATLNQYLIVDRLGAGGMGEVFRAHDTRLNRDVAIKVLPRDWVSDADRQRRFEQEGKTLATLNHPNILTIHDAGVHDGVPYLVSELLQGKTLREEISSNRSGLPVRKTIEYAQQIARGLAAAHGHSIIHRDLKPENIFITKDGRVKILDFGLAKLVDTPTHRIQTTGGLDGETSTAIHGVSAATEMGRVMGTPAYMSPEQVRGEPADHRSDVFSLGCVIYEMLVGAPAFRGGSSIEVMNAIQTADPEEILESDRVPATLDRFVRRCLQKNPADRFQSMSDAAFLLDADGSGTRFTVQTQAAKPRRHFERLGWVVAALVALIAAVAFEYGRRVPTDTEVIRFSVPPPPKATDIRDPAISPDGQRLAFVATTDRTTMLWVRPLNSLAAQPLADTAGASHPFWSPDNRMIGFFADGKLKKIPLAGGPPTTLADAPMGVGGTWNSDRTILFTPQLTTGVHRVAETGGAVEQVTTPDRSRREDSHQWPSFLPDGRHFLYFAFGSQADEIGIYVASLDGEERQRLVSAESKAVYAAPGFLIYVRGTTLLALPFDAAQRRVTGEPVRLATPMPNNIFSARETFSVSENGVLVYAASASRETEQLGWFDRSGKALGIVGSPGTDLRPALSPDDSRIAVSRLDPETQNSEIWLVDLQRGTESRFTYDPATDHDPVWSPDSSRLVWNSNREGPANLYQKAANGEGQDTLLFKADNWKWADDWSRDGRFIIYNENNPKSSSDLWILPLDGDRKPFAWRQMPFNERDARISPDSKWIAYTSDESGQFEVYVEAFPAGGKWRVSLKGGGSPRWRRDGKELFYVDADGTLTAVDVRGQTAFEAGAPLPLFAFRNIGSINGVGRYYAVTGDGQRFLIVTNRQDDTIEPFSVVLNWTQDLPR